MTDAAAAGPPLPQHHQGHHDGPQLFPSIHFLLLRVRPLPHDFQVSHSLSKPHPPGLQVVGPLHVPVGPHGLYPLNLTRLNPGPLQTVILRHAIRS